MTAKAPPKGPGRPRVFPDGFGAVDRKEHYRRQLRAAGGHAVTVDLTAAGWQALQRLAGRNERSDLIERLIRAEDLRRRTEPAGSSD